MWSHVNGMECRVCSPQKVIFAQGQGEQKERVQVISQPYRQFLQVMTDMPHARTADPLYKGHSE